MRIAPVAAAWYQRLRAALLVCLLAGLPGGCTLVEGAWDAVLGSEPEAVERERRGTNAREVIGESLRDENGRFDPSLLLRVGEDAPLLAAADPSPPAAPPASGSDEAAGQVGAADAADEGATAAVPREATFRPGDGRGTAEPGDREAARLAARNPPAPEPSQSEAGTIEAADLVLELGVIALIAAAFVGLLRGVVRHPVWAVTIAVVVGLVLMVDAYGGAG